MAECYTISYRAENVYQHPVIEASWQFLIIPEENETQDALEIRFDNSQGANWELSHNGFGFQTIRVRNRHAVEEISFEAEFRLLKQEVNPFSFDLNRVPVSNPAILNELGFRLEHQMFLKTTSLTRLPDDPDVFEFNPVNNLLENLQELNAWVYHDLKYTPGLTHVDSTLEEILGLRKGVCQDFAHLFIAIARRNGLPARYVSGYLHQGMGYFGDAQMHAWVEVLLPGIGWIGFDPTNKLVAASDHIKVAHGRDYADCAPLKGVVFGPGTNESRHQVQVQSQQ